MINRTWYTQSCFYKAIQVELIFRCNKITEAHRKQYTDIAGKDQTCWGRLHDSSQLFHYRRRFVWGKHWPLKQSFCSIFTQILAAFFPNSCCVSLFLLNVIWLEQHRNLWWVSPLRLLWFWALQLIRDYFVAHFFLPVTIILFIISNLSQLESVKQLQHSLWSTSRNEAISQNPLRTPLTLLANLSLGLRLQNYSTNATSFSLIRISWYKNTSPHYAFHCLQYRKTISICTGEEPPFLYHWMMYFGWRKLCTHTITLIESLESYCSNYVADILYCDIT